MVPCDFRVLCSIKLLFASDCEAQSNLTTFGWDPPKCSPRVLTFCTCAGATGSPGIKGSQESLNRAAGTSCNLPEPSASDINTSRLEHLHQMTQHQVGKPAGGWNKRKQNLQWSKTNHHMLAPAALREEKKERKKENELAIFSQLPVSEFCQLDGQSLCWGWEQRRV